MTDPQDLSDELEAALQGRKLLVISCDEGGNLTIEENTFHAWMLIGVAAWLEAYAESELDEEASEDETDE